MSSITWNPTVSLVGAMWGVIKTVIIVMFFVWFGWKVGLLAILLGIDIH